MSDIRPSPLVPQDVDLRDFAFMPLDVLRLRDSDLACVEDAEVFRCSVLSWCVSWHQVPAASLPDDDVLLARLLGFGRDVKGWKRVRAAGGMRGWVRCDDGRLYHQVVAEKARDAWDGKLAQRWRTEAARVKKHNQRHSLEGAAAVQMPEFAAWKEAGCPQGQALSVSGTPQTSPQGQAPHVPRETASKGEVEGEGEGQGQGQGQGDLVVGAAAPPPAAGAAATRSEPRASRLPADWALPKAWGDWALAEYPQWTPEKVRLEGQRFADHWRAKSGADATKRDWLATWRNWCRSDIAHRDDPKPNGAARPARAGPMNEADRAAFNAQANAEAKRLLGFSGDSRPPMETIDA